MTDNIIQEKSKAGLILKFWLEDAFVLLLGHYLSS